jgi:hypothetical protein
MKQYKSDKSKIVRDEPRDRYKGFDRDFGFVFSDDVETWITGKSSANKKHTNKRFLI